MNFYSLNNGKLVKFDSYKDYLESASEEVKSKVKIVKDYTGLDDPDTASTWILNNINFYIKDCCYKISKVKELRNPTEEQLKEEIKNDSSLNVAQKCWVVELLKGFNEQWMFGMAPEQKNYSTVKEYFKPLMVGQFGTDGLNSELIEYMEGKTI